MAYEDKWWQHFVPECFFDTVLLKKLLDTNKRVFHKRGCENVVNEMKWKSLKDSFGVGMVDKDKKELDYLKECDIVWRQSKGGFEVWKHHTKHHYFIQLNPPLENWILDRVKELNKTMEDFGFPSSPKALKREIKSNIDSEQNENLQRLVNAVIFAENEVVNDLKKVLLFLKENNYNTDFTKLK
jgi:hypothetical protein